ncbi:MAG: glycosyltransferase family 2 protein [Phycisphaerales bacterium]|nr:glycosyltransferase family 2 protein [Phycisphaerales bacterium]
MNTKPRNSLIIPIYKNEENIPDLLEALRTLYADLNGDLEVVLVVDGSPDRSGEMLRLALPSEPYASQLIMHSRNFGSFAAIRKGLESASGEFLAIMAADLQEPPELVLQFFEIMTANDADVVLGTRTRRADPLISRLASGLFWKAYRRWVVREMPAGGVDIFACTSRIRDNLLAMGESNTSLVSQLLWVGGRRVEVPYERRARTKGRSAWTLGRKVRYMLDSVMAFSDFPIFLFLAVGAVGITITLSVMAIVLTAWLFGFITIAGYTPVMLMISLVGSILVFGQGIIGGYIWRANETTKQRPSSIVSSHERFASQSTPRHEKVVVIMKQESKQSEGENDS